MDKFKEFIVKKELTANEKLSRVFITLCAISLASLAVLFTMGTVLQMIGFFAACLCLYGGWRLICNFFVEYEYTITNFDLDIDKIINQSKRKRLCSIDLHTVTEYGKMTEDFTLGDGETFVKASSCNPELDDYYLRFEHKSLGKAALIYTPSTEILELITSSCPRRAKNNL
jgi:hypothetical protein